ncbi:MAG: oligosaccharide flippase family protein, partial [Gammaproteobacteria bacterium]
MSAESKLNKYYGIGSVSASLKHFLLGKGFKIVSSLAILVMLARYLDKDEYAAYISFQAIIIILGLLSSLGIQAVLFRYIPELRSNGNNRAMYRLLSYGVTLRAVAIFVAVLIALAAGHLISGIFNLQGWEWLLSIYLFVGMTNQIVLSISQSLESLLWQKEAQYSLAFGSFARFVLLLGLVVFFDVTLLKAILIEGIAELLALSLLIIWGKKRWKDDEHHDEGDLGWLRENKSRVVKYGTWGFLMNQTNVLYGSAPNRLLTAHYLGPVELGILGFADTLTNLARRFMPTRLLIGFIRPVFMAKYSASGDINQLVTMSNMIYRLNLLILIVPIAILFISGPAIFDWITAGKYPQAGLL